MTIDLTARRPVALRRSWMFAPGLPGPRQDAALAARPDVLVFDLEEFTAAADRPQARAHLARLLPRCRALGMLAAVRINRLEDDGLDDLAGIMGGAPDAVLLPFSESARQMQALSAALARHEAACGWPLGQTEIVPTLETALAVVRLGEIMGADARISASLLAAEDLSADLQAFRGPEGVELAYVRARFLLECRAYGVEPIDSPFNFVHSDQRLPDLQWARQLGFRSKCVTQPAHVAVVHKLLTPQPEECEAARALLARWARQKAGQLPPDAAPVDSAAAMSAQRLLQREAAFARWSAP